MLQTRYLAEKLMPVLNVFCLYKPRLRYIIIDT